MYCNVESVKSNEQRSGLKYVEVGERMRTNCDSWSDEGRFYCRKKYFSRKFAMHFTIFRSRQIAVKSPRCS